MTTDPTTAAAILERRSIRRFDPDRPVPDSTIVRLLRLAAQAPSPYNLQPWRFLVVRDLANRDRLRRRCFGHPSLATAPVSLVLLGYHHPHRTHWGPIVEQLKARTGLSPEAEARITAEARRALGPEPDLGAWACRQSMRASAFLMMAAESLGLATAAIDRFDAGRLRLDFGIPDDHSICGLVAVGFAAESPVSPGRLPLAELCFEEHFGQPWTLGESDG